MISVCLIFFSFVRIEFYLLWASGLARRLGYCGQELDVMHISNSQYKTNHFGKKTVHQWHSFSSPGPKVYDIHCHHFASDVFSH